MNNIEIRRPRVTDSDELYRFFQIMVKDTFAREGLADFEEMISEEIENKIHYLNLDLESNGEKRYFLLALDGEQIIGTIEYGPSSKLIYDCTDGALADLVEVGTVFVHPDRQGQGVGNLLLNAMYITLQSKGIDEFCLDSGYTNAQKIWKKKFGEPVYLLKDYWSEGYDHMIWRKRVSEVPVMFRI